MVQSDSGNQANWLILNFFIKLSSIRRLQSNISKNYSHFRGFFCHLRNSTSSPLMYSVSNSLFHWGGISSLIIFLFLLSVVVYVMYSSLAGNKCSDYTTEFHLKMIDPYLMKMAWPVSSSVCSHSVLLESSLSHQVLHPTSGNFPTNDYKLLSH